MVNFEEECREEWLFCLFVSYVERRVLWSYILGLGLMGIAALLWIDFSVRVKGILILRSSVLRKLYIFK